MNGFEWVGLTTSEGVTIAGLLLDLGGIAFLSLSGIFGDRPFRRYYGLLMVERDELKEGHKSSGAFEIAPPRIDFIPEHVGDYDEAKRNARRQSIGIVLLIIGFVLQILGTAI